MALLILDRTLGVKIVPVGKNCQNKSCSMFGPDSLVKNRLLSALTLALVKLE